VGSPPVAAPLAPPASILPLTARTGVLDRGVDDDDDDEEEEEEVELEVEVGVLVAVAA